MPHSSMNLLKATIVYLKKKHVKTFDNALRQSLMPRAVLLINAYHFILYKFFSEVEMYTDNWLRAFLKDSNSW